MKSFISTLVIALVLGVSLKAQAPTLTGIHLDVYQTQVPSVIVTTKLFPVAQIVCNLTPSPINTLTVNPTSIEWDDAANPGKSCRVTDKAFFDTLSPGDYTSKAYYHYSDNSLGGTSLASNPFTRFIGSIPINIRIVR